MNSSLIKSRLKAQWRQVYEWLNAKWIDWATWHCLFWLTFFTIESVTGTGTKKCFKNFFSPFPIHRTYFWVSPSQMALLGFFHFNSVFASSIHSRKTWIHRPTGIVRERSHMVGKEEEGRRKKPGKKPLRRDRDLNPWTLSPEPSVLSIRPRRSAC